MNFTGIAVNTPVHTLNAVGEIYLPLNELSFIFATQLFQFFDKGVGFLFGDKFGSLNAVCQKF